MLWPCRVVCIAAFAKLTTQASTAAPSAHFPGCTTTSGWTDQKCENKCEVTDPTDCHSQCKNQCSGSCACNKAGLWPKVGVRDSKCKVDQEYNVANQSECQSHAVLAGKFAYQYSRETSRRPGKCNVCDSSASLPTTTPMLWPWRIYAATNWAAGKTPTVTSECFKKRGRSKSYLTDGPSSTNGTENFYHSCAYDPHPKIQIDLATTINISQVEVFNRCDCCAERLSGFKVFAGEQLCGEISSTLACAAAVINCGGQIATSVTVSKLGGLANIAEIKVYGAEPTETPTEAPTEGVRRLGATSESHEAILI